jgi:hypothetical protein
VIIMRKVLLPGLLLAVLAAGCGSASDGAGPLGPPNAAAQCMPDPGRTPVTVGETVFRDNGSVPLVIRKILLYGSRHIRLLGAFITTGDHAVVGIYSSYPPPDGQVPRGVKLASWHRAAGYVAQPHQWFSPIVGLRPTPEAARGSYARTGMDIIYTYLGSQYTLNTEFVVQLKIGSSC